MTEQELINGCRRRERGAQRQLYELYAERIYHSALRIMRDRDAAFDVAQEAFVRAFENINSFDARSTLGTWLYRIAVNEALQLLRRRETERKHLSIVAQRAVRSEQARQSTTYPDVESALAALSQNDRVVLVLKYQNGLSYDEIAAVLDCAAGTVASRLNRARERLRQILAESDATPEETGRVSHPKK